MTLLKRVFSSKKDGGSVSNNKQSKHSSSSKHSKAKEFDDIWLNIRKEDDPSVVWKQIDELGDGAFGKVWKVQQKVTGILAAAKIIPVKSEEELEEHRFEIDILSRLTHTNIIRLLDAIYSKNNQLWEMLEWCEGGALDASMLDIERPLNQNEIQIVGRHTCEALSFIHSRNVIHRDVKAGNILLTKEGICKLTDFGVSVQNDRRDEKRTTFIGTPYWMAPEVVMCETFKDMPYDAKCDVWSFGITLIEIAEMEPPHHDMNPVRVLLKIPKAEPPTLKEPELWSKEFHLILKLCMKKQPEARATAGELLQHSFLKNIESNQPLKDLYQQVKSANEKKQRDKPKITEDFGQVDQPEDHAMEDSMMESDEGHIDYRDGHADRKMDKRMKGNAYNKPRSGDKILMDGEEVSLDHMIHDEEYMNEQEYNRRDFRRQELNELRKLQHEEQRSMTILTAKLANQMETMLQHFESERIIIESKYNTEIESMSNLQKDRVQRLEKEQKVERKQLTNQLNNDQKKDRNKFMQNLKEEKQDVKRSVGRMPRSERTEALKARMQEVEQHQHYKEKAFRQKFFQN